MNSGDNRNVVAVTTMDRADKQDTLKKKRTLLHRIRKRQPTLLGKNKEEGVLGEFDTQRGL